MNAMSRILLLDNRPLSSVVISEGSGKETTYTGISIESSGEHGTCSAVCSGQGCGI